MQLWQSRHKIWQGGKMKILLYNWASIYSNLGGGVNVYIKNIIPQLIQKGHDVYFLSSGVTYTRDKKMRITQQPDWNGCHCFEIINSPVVAPAHSMFNHIDQTITNIDIKSLVHNFLRTHNFDIIHFNNIEGLSIDILDLKKENPETKFIYSFHNYNCVCPQVNLWHSEFENCINNNDYMKCVNCVIPNDLEKEIEKRICRTDPIYLRKIRFFYRHILKNIIPQKKQRENIPQFKSFQNQSFQYKNYVETLVTKINQNIDELISVSQRTKEVVCKRGIRNSHHSVLYIGTKFAELPYKNKEFSNTEDITIAYIGYMRHDKGYYYLLYLLEKIDINIARKINFIVAARTNNTHEINRLQQLSQRLKSVIFHNGYTHDNLSSILEKAELGIVPVLWEDCLPQVVYEFVCNGIPVLSSDLGGAKEIANNSKFFYKSKCIDDFENKLAFLLQNKQELKSFFSSGIRPLTINEHINELTNLYTI